MREDYWRGIHLAVSWFAFPTILFGALAVAISGIGAGLPLALVVMSVVASSAAVLLILQHYFPHTEAWRGSPKDFSIDLVHMFSTAGATDGWRTLSLGFAFMLGAWLSGLIGIGLWPHDWPIVAQLALGLLVCDFGAYWVHRICHEHALFWRIHALHHTSERLYVFSSGRNHPLNVVATFTVSMLPLAVLGANTELLAVVSVFTGVHGLLQHANVDFRHGVFNLIFSTADYHRWHHSLVIDESNANYGSNLIWYDMLFGTRFLPEDRRSPVQLGAFGLHVPEHIGHHLALPFVMERYEEAPAKAK